MIPVVILGVVVLALIAYIAWDKREQARERAELLDRVQAPEIARIAAFNGAAPILPAPKPDETPLGELVELDDDLILDFGGTE